MSGFFLSVDYAPGLSVANGTLTIEPYTIDQPQIKFEKILRPPESDFCSECEEIANACRAPFRWIAWHFWKGGESYTLSINEKKECVRTLNKQPTGTVLKVARIFFGIIFAVPGQILGCLFMGLAYLSEEIQVKHRIVREGEKESQSLLDFFKDKEKCITDQRVELKFEPNRRWGYLIAKKEYNKKTVLERVIQDGKEIVQEKVTYEGIKSYERYLADSNGKTYNNGKIYNTDSCAVIRIKGIGLIIFSPIVSLIKSVFFAVMIPLTIALIVPFKILDGRISCLEGGKMIGKGCVDLFREVFYAVPLVLAAAFMVFFPIWGRPIFGYLERKSNGHGDSMHGGKFYRAVCMQFYGRYERRGDGFVYLDKRTVGVLKINPRDIVEVSHEGEDCSSCCSPTACCNSILDAFDTCVDAIKP